MTPNIDRNEAPETWITAAPMDTLTLQDKDGRPVDKDGNPIIFPVLPTQIPVRFHLYWAGSDKDGAVAGFYYAVVETTAVPVDGLLPPLPGPKPGQYSFTTKTDTTFVFTVSEMFADRKHAFFLYAVDNQGKPDATPARFIFSAVDKFPPRPVFKLARAYGETVLLSPTGAVVSEWLSYPLTRTLKDAATGNDTVPAYSRLDFAWQGEITQPGTFVAGYRYKLDELEFQRADSSVRAVSYGTDLPGSPPVAPGDKVFTLRALDQSGGGDETTRRFTMNFVPDTWWAGPNPDDFPVSTDGEYHSHSVEFNSWPKPGDTGFDTKTPFPAGSFGPDSFEYRPSRRLPPNLDFFGPSGRTFYEIYKNRLYARSEGDTVHKNSFIVLWNGGYDKDSRYVPRVDSTDQHLRGSDGRLATGAVIEAAGRVGSPIGFRSQFAISLTPVGLKSVTAQTSVYPVYEPASVFRSPRMGGYWRMRAAGKVYALARAEDADDGLDNAVDDPMTEVTTNGPSRRKVLVFYVDKAPALVRTGIGAADEFWPYEGQVFPNIALTNEWNFKLHGMDLDPFDPTDFSTGGGGPTAKTTIRYKVTLYGKDLEGRNLSWTYLGPDGLPYIVPADGLARVDLSFIPGGPPPGKNPFAEGPIRVSIQICDCDACELVAGQGRCVDGIDPGTGEVPSGRSDFSVNNVITVQYTGPASKPGLGTTQSTGGRPGPDPSSGRD